MEKKSEQNKAPKFEGEILLCEDNEINQHFIKTHLTRVGLSVVVAGDGSEGVQKVSERQKPFDLIFMDIQMPVMDGMEAADKIIAMGVKTPIVALTSNVTPSDCEVYAAHGMKRALCKPFTADSLWECLSEYFTPISYEEASEKERQSEEEKQKIRLYSGFVRRNQTTYEDIVAALDAGDVKLAHRLAHTLRGLAGLMGKKDLQESARLVESALAGGDASALDRAVLDKTGRELKQVLAELAEYLGEGQRETPSDWNKEEAASLFEQLETLLREDNAQAQKLCEKLRAIPGSSGLITDIEDYEFEKALTSLANLKNSLHI